MTYRYTFPGSRVQSLRVRDFTNTLGATVSTAAFGTPDTDIPTLVRNLQYAGISTVRTGMPATAGAGMPGTGDQVYIFPIFQYLAAAGIRFCVGPAAGGGKTIIVADVIAGLKTIAGWVTGGLKYIEGPNEPCFDLQTYNGATCSSSTNLPAALFARDFYKALKADPLLCNIPVLSCTQTGQIPDDCGLQFLSVPQGYSNRTLNTTASYSAASPTPLQFSSTAGLQVGQYMYCPLFQFNGGGIYIASLTSTTVTTGGANPQADIPAGTPVRFGSKVPDGTVFADILNIHTYPMGGGVLAQAQAVDPVGGDVLTINLGNQFVSTNLAHFSGYTLSQAVALPKVITEYGYQTSGASAGGDRLTPTIAGRNLMTGWLSAFVRGYSDFMVYSLFDESASNGFWGLYNFDETAKPAATYLHNLTTALADGSPTASRFVPGSLGVSLSGLPASGDWRLFQRSTDRAFLLILWNSPTNWNVAAGTPITIASAPVTVTFERSGTISVFDPTSGTAATSTTVGSSVTVGLTDYPLVVSFQ